MNTINVSRYKFIQPIDHLLLLQDVAQDYLDGCLRIFSASQHWSIFFQKGQLIYACQSNDMWNIFYNKFLEIRPDFINYGHEAYRLLKLIFNSDIDKEIPGKSNYLAICWLVNQQYLNSLQAAKLIEEIAIEVIDSFLKFQNGICEYTPNSFLDVLPKFCHTDIFQIVRRCQVHSLKLHNFTYPVDIADNSLFVEVQQLVSLDRGYIPQSENKAAQQNIDKYVENLPEKNTKLGKREEETKIYKVMCIDDSPAILRAIRGFLDEQYFDVIEVNDSLKALTQIIHTKPDIILLDISMPNLDGYEFCSLLRKHRNFCKTPVIMVTARTGFIDKARAKMVKASGYLTKPFTQFDLFKIVFQELGRIS